MSLSHLLNHIFVRGPLRAFDQTLYFSSLVILLFAALPLKFLQMAVVILLIVLGLSVNFAFGRQDLIALGLRHHLSVLHSHLV